MVRKLAFAFILALLLAGCASHKQVEKKFQQKAAYDRCQDAEVEQLKGRIKQIETQLEELEKK